MLWCKVTMHYMCPWKPERVTGSLTSAPHDKARFGLSLNVNIASSHVYAVELDTIMIKTEYAHTLSDQGIQVLKKANGQQHCHVRYSLILKQLFLILLISLADLKSWKSASLGA